VTLADGRIPPAAARHFSRDLTTGQALEHPVISQVFWSGRWRPYPPCPPVSHAALRVLRRKGVTHVQLSACNHTADFTMTELLRRRA
jgi:hypothetical protein